MNKNEVKCIFVSVWDEDIEIKSDALLNKETGEITVLEKQELPNDINFLTDEYIIAEPDEHGEGKYFKVCQDCHDHVIGFMGMWDDPMTGNYEEHYGCPVCNEEGDPLVKDWYDHGSEN